MNLTKWTPWANSMELPQRLTRLFEDFFDREWSEKSSDSLPSWYPVTDIYETQDSYIFKMEVPGLKREDIQIELSEGSLSIKGEKKEEKKIDKDSYHRVESYFGGFQRVFSLPRNVDAQKVTANLNNGILELKVPRLEVQNIRAIPITIE